MPKVHLPQYGKTLEIPEGRSILEVALENHVPVEHTCGGYCACATCHIHVKAGGENLSPADDDEKERVQDAVGYDPALSRLSCQCKVLRGEVTVEVIGSGWK